METPSLEGLPTKAKEDPSLHEMRLSPAGHQPSISWVLLLFFYYCYYYYYYYYYILLLLLLVVVVVVVVVLWPELL